MAVMLAHPHRFSRALEDDIIRSDLAGSSRKHDKPDLGLDSKAEPSKPTSAFRKEDAYSSKASEAETLFLPFLPVSDIQSHKAYSLKVSMKNRLDLLSHCRIWLLQVPSAL